MRNDHLAHVTNQQELRLKPTCANSDKIPFLNDQWARVKNFLHGHDSQPVAQFRDNDRSSMPIRTRQSRPRCICVKPGVPVSADTQKNAGRLPELGEDAMHPSRLIPPHSSNYSAKSIFSTAR